MNKHTLTNQKLRKMFLYINSELFSNELPEPEFFVFHGTEKLFPLNFPANEIQGICVPCGNHYFIGLHVNQNLNVAFCTMVHEMIHIWQMENNKSPSHSGWFMVWCNKAIEEFFYMDIN